MSQESKEGPYIYQPYGTQHPDRWRSGRIYGIGGLPVECKIDGLLKEEAEAFVAVFRMRDGKIVRKDRTL